MDTSVTFSVNGQERTVATDSARSLLDVLREDLSLLGTKYGCGEGRCGACTVLVDGVEVRSCVTRVGDVAGKTVLTIEGLQKDGSLHPVQEAFVEEGAIQCGYCTPGMVLGAVALLRENPRPSEAEIVQGMDGHLCRCCGYPKIVKAICRAALSGEKKP